MRPSIFAVLACACLSGVVATAHAQQPPTPPADTAATVADTAATAADTAAAAPHDSTKTVPPPAVAAPVAAPTTAPAPATAPPPSTPPPPTKTQAPAKEPTRVYYGGTIGLGFYSDVFRFYVQPMMGYKLTPKVSGGGKLLYEYLQDKHTHPSTNSNNYGASIFARYRIKPMAYAHAEYAMTSYDTGNDRTTVPYLLLGGGYVKPLAKNAGLTVEVLFDVLQDKNSPYDAWEPWVTVGVGVGF